MKKFILGLFTACILLVNANTSHACSCFPTGYHFCETLQNDSSVASVVMVQKTADYHYGMRVKLIQLISGEAIADSFVVWGDNGALCRLYTGGWAVGDTIVMALHHCDMWGNIIVNADYPPNLETEHDYHISGCGVYSLNVENGQVKGPINTTSMQSMFISDFLQESCVYVLSNEENTDPHAVNIYPNPATEQISFIVADNQDLVRNISIINAEGRVVFQQAAASLNNPVNIESLGAGIYSILLWNEKGKTSISFIKTNH